MPCPARRSLTTTKRWIVCHDDPVRLLGPERRDCGMRSRGQPRAQLARVVAALACLSAVVFSQVAPNGARAEASRPKTGGYWILTGSPPVSVAQQTATLLRTGDVLAVGGCRSCTPNYVQLYHPSTGSWSLTTQTPHP